ncbi:MAG: hypothetical protein ACPLXC_02665 [Candidatus Pacearchaeota archaeon]
MGQKELSDIVEDINSQEILIGWELQLKAGGIYEFLREEQGVCKTRLYIEMEEGKFSYAYIVINPLGKVIENGKGHYSEAEEIKKNVLGIISRLNGTYFTEPIKPGDPGHNAPTQQSNS